MSSYFGKLMATISGVFIQPCSYLHLSDSSVLLKFIERVFRGSSVVEHFIALIKEVTVNSYQRNIIKFAGNIGSINNSETILSALARLDELGNTRYYEYYNSQGKIKRALLRQSMAA